MMTLLGQHGQKQDYELGSRLIRLAAETADENAPQGAYVSSWSKLGVMLDPLDPNLWSYRSTECYSLASCPA
jgi:hypothetical protein